MNNNLFTLTFCKFFLLARNADKAKNVTSNVNAGRLELGLHSHFENFLVCRLACISRSSGSRWVGELVGASQMELTFSNVTANRLGPRLPNWAGGQAWPPCAKMCFKHWPDGCETSFHILVLGRHGSKTLLVLGVTRLLNFTGAWDLKCSSFFFCEMNNQFVLFSKHGNNILIDFCITFTHFCRDYKSFAWKYVAK